MSFPRATYRLQLHKDFTFADAAALAPYLKALGVSHAYLSPVMECMPGSLHGYDVADFAKVSAERGGETGLKALAGQLAANGLEIMLDIVPNHMAAALHNPYWRDVLQNGPASPYWHFFDLFVPDGKRLMLPVLDCTIDEALAAGRFSIGAAGREKVLQLNGMDYPLAPGTDGETDIAALLSRQHYGFMAYWKLPRIQYRRFFNVADLVCLRVEDETVFEATHAKLRQLLHDLPGITALRVDHIDGLAKPGDYLERLGAFGRPAWVEKILASGEALPTSWAAEGTSGYEFAQRLHGLLVNRAGFEKIQDYWLKNIDASWPDFESCVYDSKKEAIADFFAPDLDRLAAALEPDAAARDTAGKFIASLTAALPLYRIYPEENIDAALIEKTAEAAAAREGDWFAKAAAKYLPAFTAPAGEEGADFLRRWCQFSGPAMAKGLEDRAHYRFTPLAAFNEVGGSPALPGDTGLAAYCAALPPETRSLNASTTHDTKRSEDARMRLLALCDRPADWIDFCGKAFAAFKPHAVNIPAHVQYFFLQAVIASFPPAGAADDIYIQRLRDYMIKSSHEEARHSSWLKPEKDYEERLLQFVNAAMADETFKKLLGDLLARLGPAAACYSLVAQALKILSPGIPDFYQGSELWELSLVDPDNRRPVDYALRRRLLDEIKRREEEPGFLKDLLERWQDGGVKLWLTRQLLKIRAEYFTGDDMPKMQPLEMGDGLIAYRLVFAKAARLVILPRNPSGLEVKTAATLPGHKPYRCLLSGRHWPANTPLSEVLAAFPLAVLEG